MSIFSKTSAAAALLATLAGPAAANCINLFQHIPPGPFTGITIQADPNTVMILEPAKFFGPPGNPQSNFGSTEMVAQRCFGGPEVLNLNNVNLLVTIKQKDPNVKQANINFCEYGGYENVGANHDLPPAYIGDIDAVGPTLPNANGDPEDVQTVRSGDEGKLVFTSRSDYIQQMLVGGQEFFVHSICY